MKQNEYLKDMTHEGIIQNQQILDNPRLEQELRMLKHTLPRNHPAYDSIARYKYALKQQSQIKQKGNPLYGEEITYSVTYKAKPVDNREKEEQKQK